MTPNYISPRISRRFSMLALASAFAALLGVNTACNTSPKGPVTVPMEYRATENPLTGSLPTSDVRVHLEGVEDKRQDKDHIGRNSEDATPLPVFASGKSPAEFVRDAFETELKNFNVELVDAPEAADRIIAIDLSKFWVEETGEYNAEVNGQVKVRDKGGKVVWQGRMAGANDTFGRSRSPANYIQVLSNATRQAIGSVINNPKFGEALSR